jgi:hypothetical protein
VAAPVEVELTLLDAAFRVRAHDRRLAALVELLWEPFLGVEEGASPAVVELSQDGDRWRLDWRSRPPAFALDPWVLCGVLRSTMADRAIRSRPDLIALHASVVETDGFYLALSGPSKAGKTTLLMELLLRGWRLVSDDLAPIAPAEGTALPFPNPVHVRDADRWMRFRGWDVPEWLPEPAGSALIPPTAVSLAPPRPYRPDGLLFIRWEPDGAGALDRLTPAEAAARCVENLQADLDVARVLAPLARLCGAASTARLVYPSSEKALEFLGSFLHGHAGME